MGVWARTACKNLGPPIYFCNHWS